MKIALLKLVVVTLVNLVASGPTATEPVASDSKTAPIRVACVGDSITAGARIKDRSQTYPAQLAAMLGDKYQVQNFGQNSVTLLKKAKPWRNRAAFEFQPNIVVINLGTNDSKDKFWQHKDDFLSDYTALINRFQTLASKPRILICYPTPCHKDFPERNEIITREIIPTITKVACETHVDVVDLHSPLKGRKELYADEVHPNAEGARLIAEIVKAAMLTRQTTGAAGE